MSSATAALLAEKTSFLAGKEADPAQLAAWAEAFNRDGYIFITDVLPPERCAELREDLASQITDSNGPIACRHRMFEKSQANLDLFDLEPIVTLAETILGEDNRYGRQTAHVVHNNAFRTRNGGGFSDWHQDESPHFVVTHGEAPTNIHLPCLSLTCNYYLTDQEGAEYGCGQVLPGSHKWGIQLPKELAGTPFESKIVSCGGKQGSVMIFNSQVWHRGAPNHSDRDRYVTQVTYGRRMVGHYFAPFMNYQMPAHCLEGANPRRRRLLGFKVNGAYG